MDYPYYNKYVDEKNILKGFKKLKNYKPSYKKINYGNSKICFIEKYNTLNRITDYFSEDCRVNCSFKKNKKPIEKYQEIKHLITSKMNYDEIDTILYNNIKYCSNFNITLVVSIFKFFKPENVLDFSAGWGDRLIGAMAYGCKYTGVDPSNCMNKRYKKMIEILDNKNKDNYKVYNKGFEDFDVKKNTYDLVFTSPPFFDLEIYEDSISQSAYKFNNVEKWKKNFLFPSLKKSFYGLKKNGYIAIYISDYTLNGKRVSYVNDMKQYIKYNLNMKYVGTINWDNISNKNSGMKNVYLWVKLVN
jgi:tRNA1(Val) A37 N6-methylase TrmN6